MALETVAQLISRFKNLGAERIFCKRLSENDNSKQQIYLGSSFEVLSFFPHGEITAFSELRQPNFKASIDFYWIDVDTLEKAAGTQLILYPAYPEVRLSGFLNGCKGAPSKHLRQKPKEQRRGTDGRVLVFATTGDKRTFAYLAPENSPLASELLHNFSKSPQKSLFFELTLPIGSQQNKGKVLEALRHIHAEGFHPSSRRDKHGNVIPYKASNGAGFTLESLLGITPNSKPEPDYLGWEIKTHSTSRITLMTPEPRGGFYGERGAKAFVEHYGHEVDDGKSMYFTGNHTMAIPCIKTGLTLHVNGFDSASPKSMDVNGAIQLIDSSGNEAASWPFTQLLTHWNQKHAFAVYIKYTSQKIPLAYRYDTPILMGEHTDFQRYLTALCSGAIIFDPGSKVTNAKTPESTIKSRSQFRIHAKNLNLLYEKLTQENLA